MNTTAKIELALDIYRLCKTEPHFFRAWVHYHDTDRDVWRKEIVPESQFGFVLAIMRNPTSNQEIGCITEFLDEEKEHVAGTPTVAYVPHDPEEPTMTPNKNPAQLDYRGVVKGVSYGESLEFRLEGERKDWDVWGFTKLTTMLNWYNDLGVEPEEVTINVEE